MEESRFRSNCQSHSFYISLAEQRDALAADVQTSFRQTLKDHSTTYIHLGITYVGHWAAIQISVSPFAIQNFPGQIFFACHLRYSLCCKTAATTNFYLNIIKTTQRVYDSHNSPSQWDFTNERYHTWDYIESAYEKYTCAKRVEAGLLKFQRNVKDCTDTSLVLCEGRIVKEPYNGGKRRKLNHPDQQEFNKIVAGYEGDEQDSTNYLPYRLDSHDMGKEQNVGNAARPGNAYDIEFEHLGIAAVKDENRKVVDILTKKIQSGLKLSSARVQPDLPSCDVSSFRNSLLSSDWTHKETTALKMLLWDPPSSALLGHGEEMLWKYKFIASCLQTLRDDMGAYRKPKNWRWNRAVRMINLIVDGLFQAWGPKAFLVYEALAAKKYYLTEMSSFSEKRQQEILSSIIKTLSNGRPPDTPTYLVFHPAAYISAVMDEDYQRVCSKLNLSRFARLHRSPSVNMHVEMSALLKQWELLDAPPCIEGDRTNTSLDESVLAGHRLTTDATNSSIGSLLVLLYSLGGSEIRRDILLRGLSQQKRWDDRGNVHELSICASGLGEQITSLFSSEAKLEENIRASIQLGSIVVSGVANGSLAYSISDLSRLQIFQSYSCEELQQTGLMFTIHIYPRDHTLEPSFQTLGKLLLPYLERGWRYIQEEPRRPPLPVRIRNSLAEASLACLLVGTTRSVDMISVLTQMHDLDLPDHLRMAIAARKSTSLRLNGDYHQSDVVIQAAEKSIAVNTSDTRLHCSYGRLVLSRVENAILREEFDIADEHLTSWEVKNSPPSGLELQVVRLKNTVIGRVSRYKGDFDNACHCLEECLKTVPGAASRYHIMHHLADVYCELRIPLQAHNLVLGEVNRLRALGKRELKTFRRLGLPLAEAYLEQNMFEEANAVLQELLQIYNGIIDHDSSDQLGHVRVMIGIARVKWHIKHWSEACRSLENALVFIGKYSTFSEGTFYLGVVNLFLSLANFELQNYPRALEVRALADSILRKQKPRHFIPGMGSYFLRYLKETSFSVRSIAM